MTKEDVSLSATSFFKSLKITDPEKVRNLDFISSLDKDEVISKLLLAIFSLQKNVQDLSDKVDQYESLNKLLVNEDLSQEISPPNSPPTKVTKISPSKSDESTPPGFSPMYSTPALSESEIVERPAKRQQVIKPWPEVTLTQLANRFKVPRDQLHQLSRTLDVDKRSHLRSLKPNIHYEIKKNKNNGQASKLSSKRGRPLKDSVTPSSSSTSLSKVTNSKPSSSRSNTTPTDKVAEKSFSRQSRNSTKRQLEEEESKSQSQAQTQGQPRLIGESLAIKNSFKRLSTPILESQMEESKKWLKYSMTKEGLFKCDTCGDRPAIYSNYLALFQHKKSHHDDEFEPFTIPESESETVLLPTGSANKTTITTTDDKPKPKPPRPSAFQSAEGYTYTPRKIGNAGPINIRMADMYVKIDDRNYRCKFCNSPFTSYHGVYFHLKNVHTDPETGMFVQSIVKLSERKKFKRMLKLQQRNTKYQGQNMDLSITEPNGNGAQVEDDDAMDDMADDDDDDEDEDDDDDDDDAMLQDASEYFEGDSQRQEHNHTNEKTVNTSISIAGSTEPSTDTTMGEQTTELTEKEPTSDLKQEENNPETLSTTTESNSETSNQVDVTSNNGTTIKVEPSEPTLIEPQQSEKV